MRLGRRFFAVACMAAALIISGGPAAGQPAQPAPAPLTVEALAELPYLSGPILSADGNRVAARLTVDNKEWIGVWDLRQPMGTLPRLFEQHGFEVRWLRWAGPNRLLLGVLLTSRLDGHLLPVTRIVSLDVNSWRLTPLNTGQGILGDTVIFVDPQGNYALAATQPLADQYPDVLRIDLATGASTIEQRGRTGVWNWFADQHGVVRAGVEYTDNRIKLYYRAGPGEELRRIESRRYPQDDSVIELIRFTGNADRGIVVTNAVTGRFGVYDYDFVTDTRGEPIFEHPEVDVTAPIIGQDGRVEGVSFEDDRRRTRWFNPELERMQGVIDRALPGKVNLINDLSDDRNRALVFSSAADDPGTYYVYDRTTRRIEAFGSPYAQLNGHRFAPVRPIAFRSRDGVDLHGYLTLPPGRGERGLPLILMPHGGPFARDSWQFDPWVQFLASRGYAVLQVNFRGSTGYGRAFAERGYGQFGTGMIDDLEDGVDWLVGQGIADPRRVCAMGASYGGYAALWAPIRHPDRYRCAISFAGVTDVRALLRYDRRLFAAQRYSREWQRRVQGEERSDLDAISPLQQAARITVPVLIAHGERDPRVPVAQSRNLVRAMGRAGSRMESVFYPEAYHGFTRPEDSADFLRRVEAFLARHNPADAPPAVAAASH